MDTTKINKYAVFGNPIGHSLSPIIHNLFAQQFNFALEYIAIEGSNDLDVFKEQFLQFFKNGANGCNVTSPFKTIVYDILENKSQRCQLAKACNTVILQDDGTLYGENTDGYGLIQDLMNLGWLDNSKKVLILGAGGAVRGVLFDLLIQQLDITIYNRTKSRVDELISDFSEYGKIKYVNKISFTNFDLVINALALKDNDKIDLKKSNIAPETKFYDMQYSNRKSNETIFLNKIKNICNNPCKDGIGMLVNQAAKSFCYWFDKLPNDKFVEKRLRDLMK